MSLTPDPQATYTWYVLLTLVNYFTMNLNFRCQKKFRMLYICIVHCPSLSQKPGTLKLNHPSVCYKVTWLIFSEVLKIEHWYLACMILVTSPFNWHHTVTLTFDLLQSQSCCRAGDHSSPNLLVMDKPAFRTNLNEAVLAGEIPPPPTFINLWWNNCDKAFSISQNFVKS